MLGIGGVVNDLAAQEEETGRLMCEPLRSLADANPVAASERACFRNLDGSAIELFTEDASGNRVLSHRVELPLPWLDLTFLRDRTNRDWLIANYYADTPRPSGQNAFVEIYEGKARHLSSWSARDARVEDLDNDGFVEVVISPLVFDTRYPDKPGMPLVIGLEEDLVVHTFHEYPAVREAFVSDLRELIEHLNRVCTGLSDVLGESSCDYSADLDVLQMQLNAASTPVAPDQEPFTD